MRIEGEDDGAHALAPGHLQQALDNAGVTPVHAVEIPDRDDAAAKSLRQVVQVTVEDRHRFTRRDRATTGSITLVLRSIASTIVRCSAPSPLLATTGST